MTLIDPETGKFDWVWIHRHAVARACASWGPSPPIRNVREKLVELQAIAREQQIAWEASR